MFCRTDVVTRNRERIKMARKTVIAALGKAKAMDLCLTARFMDAAKAEESGLVDRVIPADRLPEEPLIRRFRNEPEFPVDRSRCVPGIEPC
jgi:hypothetical protein